MEHHHIDLDGGWMDYPRGKTGVGRRAKLWDETCDAIREGDGDSTADRQVATCGSGFFRDSLPQAVEQSHDERLQHALSLSRRFMDLARKEVRSLSQKNKGFYTLRHVAETIGGESRDQKAVDWMLGHDDGSMSNTYIERISDERLEAVADTIHAWLYASGRKPR